MELRSDYFLKLENLSGIEQVLLFHNGEILHRNENFFWPATTLQNIGIEPQQHSLIVGEFSLRRCLALGLSDESFRLLDAQKTSLRELLLSQTVDVFDAVGRANQLLHWYDNHRYCGRCGASTEPHSCEQALVCTACKLNFYPRINPCVIVLVVKHGEMLLARHFGKASAFFSCLAGFMEVGETPEEAVMREVQEEVGIEVDNIRYIRSQSWPFPSQLMLGFFADYKSGEIRVDGKEIAEAGWFGSADLPITPAAGISVAGQLIELFLQRFELRERTRI